MQIELIFTRNVLQLVSFWKGEFLELGNGLLAADKSYTPAWRGWKWCKSGNPAKCLRFDFNHFISAGLSPRWCFVINAMIYSCREKREIIRAQRVWQSDSYVFSYASSALNFFVENYLWFEKLHPTYLVSRHLQVALKTMISLGFS